MISPETLPLRMFCFSIIYLVKTKRSLFVLSRSKKAQFILGDLKKEKAVYTALGSV